MKLGLETPHLYKYHMQVFSMKAGFCASWKA